MTIQKIFILLHIHILHQFCMHYLLIRLDYTWKWSMLHIIVPSLFQWDSCLIDNLILSFLPLYFKIGLGDTCWLDILHIIYSNLFSDQIRLFQSSLIIIINIPIHNTKLTITKPKLSSQYHWLIRSQINTLSFLQHQHFYIRWKLNLYIK